MPSELVSRIAADAGLPEDDVARRIEEKQIELSGLISEEGAAYIVAKELGVALARKQERLKVAHIIPGMQNVDIVAKLVRIFAVRHFEKEDVKGRVMNMLLADETGLIRLSLWNEEIDKYLFNVDDVVHVRGYVKENNLGEPEIRLGRYGAIQITSEEIQAVYHKRVERSDIAQLDDGSYREIRAALLQVFEYNPFFEVCPECDTRLKNDACGEHGAVAPNYRMVVSGIVDDGTDNIRAVFFAENAERILGMNTTEARDLFMKRMSVAPLLAHVELGKEYLFEGRVKKNAFFNNLEFIVNAVRDVDTIREIETLMGR